MGALGNAVPLLVLRSPLHGLLSRNALVITFTGRRTRRRYDVPVTYSRDGDGYMVATGGAWWRNLRDGREVEMLVRGRRVRARATVQRRPDRVERALRLLCRDHVTYARSVRLPRGADGEPDFATAATQRVAIRLVPLSDAQTRTSGA